MSPDTPLLTVQGLDVDVAGESGMTHAVKRLQLAISRRETFALVGESGCGKSMTALALLRLLPDAGRIVGGQIDLDGEDLNRLPESAMRGVRGGRIGIIFQEPSTSLNPVMRVGDQIIETLTAHTPLRGAAARARQARPLRPGRNAHYFQAYSAAPMDIFIQQLINGVTLGSVYALVALGYTMVYGIIGLINFAHGDVVMIGAMAATTIAISLVGGDPGASAFVVLGMGLLVSVPLCMAVGWTAERVAYRPLRRAPRLAALITAIGVSIILQNVAMMGWGRNYLNFPQVLSPQVFEFAGARMSTLQIAIVVIAALIMGGLLAVVHKTRLGTAMRATAQNREVAGLMGVNINTVISAAFLIGSALAAVAGMMVATYYGVSQYTMGFMLGLKAFTAAVLGGIGNLVGAMAGGLLLGIIESLGAGYIGDLTGGFLGSHYQDVFAFFVLVLVLIFRPSGLLGERVGDRA